MTSFLCVGEPLVSLVPPHGSDVETTESLAVSTGGAEVNVAVHLARSGVPVAFAGRVGDDAFGRRAERVLEAAGVSTEHLERDPLRPTGLYVKEVHGERTTMRYYRRGSAATVQDHLPEAAFEGVRRVHVTGITVALSASCRALVHGLLDRDGVEVSFDVNHRPALWGADEAGPVLLGIARRAHTVFVGLDEALALWGCPTAAAVRELLPEPVELVVKDGAGPATVFTGDQALSVPAPQVDVVEAVGAGDAFAAGYLAARWHAHDVETAVQRGHQSAGAVLRVLGDHAATDGPTRVEELLP